MRQHAYSGLFSWCLTPYASDIHGYLKKKEFRAIKMYFRSPQLKYRQELVSWIRKVSSNMKLSNTTVHLAVRLIDLFMDAHNITEKGLASSCLACLLVAAKFEEEDSKIPKLKDLSALVNNETTKAEFMRLEFLVMTHFNWFVGHVTAAHFAEYYMFFAIVKGDKDHFGTSHRHLEDLVQSSMRDFLDLSLTELYMNEFMSSKVAASCLLAARLEHGVRPVWPKVLSNITGYSLSSLQPCLDLLKETNNNYGAMDKADSRNDSGYESCSPGNVCKKPRINLKNIK